MLFIEFCDQIGLQLEPFQKRIAKTVTGPQREALVLLPKGNGKTTLMAATALWYLTEKPGAKIYCAASSIPQARILFEQAQMFLRRLQHPNLVERYHEIRWCDDPEQPKVFSRHMRVLSADANRLQGLEPTVCFIDELHAHRDDSVYVALRTSVIKQPDAKLVTISTAGAAADSALGRLRARCLALPTVTRTGALTSAQGPSLSMLEWSLTEDDDYTDAKAAKTVNPASWISTGDLAEQFEAVPLIAYQRYHLNMWVESPDAWLPAGAWNQCVGEPEFTPGEEVFVGVDVGGADSATAVCWINQEHHVGVWIGHGDPAVLEAKAVIEDLASTYSIREVVFDPWRAGQLAQELEQQGVQTTAFPQSDSRMIPASDRLYRAVTSRKLTVPNHPELRAHAATAIARHSRRGWRIDKANRTDQIDSIIALCMCVDALETQPQPAELLAWI